MASEATRLIIIGIGVFVIADVVLVLAWARWRARRWRADLDTARASLLGSGGPVPVSFVSDAMLESVPEPASRYFRRVLPAGAGRIRTARLGQRGEFRTAPGAGWKPFEATELFATGPRGFLWEASIEAARFMTVAVADSYREGRARMQVRLYSALTIVNQSDDPQLATGALSRLLAEAVWLPTALLPGDGLRWRARDASSARVELSDAGVSVSALFHFTEAGEIHRVEVADRPRFVDGAFVPCRWVGTFGNYQLEGGYRIPTEAEVAWELESGSFSYWRGRITKVDYDRGAS